jgi:homoserine O-succinyltransferase
MPVLIEGGRVPHILSRKNHPHAQPSTGSAMQAGQIRIALINNMPDSALADTELQFVELLESAAGEISLSLRLYSLPKIPRGHSGHQHLNNYYFEIGELLNSRFDGVIVTGTEPVQPDLREEPYWPILTEVLDWAERSTISTVLSCLAAHASVLYSDSIPRVRLRDKQFGVFAHENIKGHTLTANIGGNIRIAHSRWNEVRGDALSSCGYEVLTESPTAGVDLFVKKKKGSLFVHFQGHPEYSTRTLLKEFRRDVRRFLRRERETYPSMPVDYFDGPATRLLVNFQTRVLDDPREELLADFPHAAVAVGLQNTWHDSAVRVYRNWLRYVILRKAETSAPWAMTPFVPEEVRQRKRR